MKDILNKQKKIGDMIRSMRDKQINENNFLKNFADTSKKVIAENINDDLIKKENVVEKLILNFISLVDGFLRSDVDMGSKYFISFDKAEFKSQSFHASFVKQTERYLRNDNVPELSKVLREEGMNESWVNKFEKVNRRESDYQIYKEIEKEADNGDEEAKEMVEIYSKSLDEIINNLK